MHNVYTLYLVSSALPYQLWMCQENDDGTQIDDARPVMVGMTASKVGADAVLRREIADNGLSSTGWTYLDR